MLFFNKKDKSVSTEFCAFLQAVAVLIYCGFVATVMSNATEWFGKFDQTTGPFMFLALFSTSVLTSGILVFGKAFVLYFKNDKKEEGIKLVLFTAAWLLLITVLGFLIMAII